MLNPKKPLWRKIATAFGCYIAVWDVFIVFMFFEDFPGHRGGSISSVERYAYETIIAIFALNRFSYVQVAAIVYTIFHMYLLSDDYFDNLARD